MSEIPTSQADEVGSPHSVLSIVLRLLAAVAVAALAILVQRTVLADDPSRSTFGVKVRSYPIESELLERTMSSRVVVPPGAPPKDRPLVVFLHGRGEDERSYLIEPMFEALSDLRSRAPVMVFPSGGDSSYWHDRESGAWGSYVLDEVIPDVVERFDIDPDQIAIGGISMGGFGAFDIARLDPERFCAAAGHSPVIWETASETADGAFDNADDFERNDVITIAGSEPNPYDDMRVWLDAGDDDPFLAGDEAFEQALREQRRAADRLALRGRARLRLLERQLGGVPRLLRPSAGGVRERAARGGEGRRRRMAATAKSRTASTAVGARAATQLPQAPVEPLASSLHPRLVVSGCHRRGEVVELERVRLPGQAAVEVVELDAGLAIAAAGA